MSPVPDENVNARHREHSAYLRVRQLWVGPQGHIMLGVFATGPHNPAPQWQRPGLWAVDLEGWTTLRFDPDLHVERAFRDRERALAFARFLEWCVDGLTDEQLVECARVTGGRLL